MSLDILTLLLLVAQPALITGCGYQCSAYSDYCYQYNMVCDQYLGFCGCKPGYTYQSYEPCCVLNQVVQTWPQYQTTPRPCIGYGCGGHVQCVKFDISEWRQRMLRRTNEIRALYGAKPLQEDLQLSKEVQGLAEYTAATGALKDSQCKQYNAYFYYDRPGGFSGFRPEAAVEIWYSRKTYWNFERNQAMSPKAGLFVALVWKASRKVGYGVAFNPSCTKIYLHACYFPESSIDHPGENVGGHTKETPAPPPVVKTTAPPPPVEPTEPSQEAKTTAPPTPVESTEPTEEAKTTAPPPPVEPTAPPEETKTTTRPIPVEPTASPEEGKTTARPIPVEPTAPPQEGKTTARPIPVDPTAPPAGKMTIGPPAVKATTGSPDMLDLGPPHNVVTKKTD